MKLHSKVDLITNSSQEVFILPTDKSLKEVKEELQFIWLEISKHPFPFNTLEKAEVGFRGLNRYTENHTYVKWNKEQKEKGNEYFQEGFDGEWHAYMEYNIGNVVVSAGYYWGMTHYPGSAEGDYGDEEQERFERKLDEHFPGWWGYQIG